MQTLNSASSFKSRGPGPRPRAGGAGPPFFGAGRLPAFRLGGLATILLIAGAAAGQSPTLLSLDQAIDLALTHNHALKATRTLILQNQDQEITANLRPNPTFGADSQFIPIFTPQDFSLDNLNVTQQFDIGIGYLFERGHKRQRRLQAARDQTAVTRAQVADAERSLAFNVGQQFVSVLLAESTPAVCAAGLAGFSANGRHRRRPVQSR